MPEPRTEKVAFDTVVCTIKNPLTHARVIYDGVKNDKPIRIEPGETKEGVILAEHVLEKLKASGDDMIISDQKPGPTAKAIRPLPDSDEDDDDELPSASKKKK